MNKPQNFFHLHLISDATGETLLAAGRAAAAQYKNARAIEHIYPLIRTDKQLENVFVDIEEAPGIVLYTVVDQELAARIDAHCQSTRPALRLRARAGAAWFSSPISVRRPAAASAHSTCSMRIISAASTRSTSPWSMMTASCRRTSKKPTSS